MPAPLFKFSFFFFFFTLFTILQRFPSPIHVYVLSFFFRHFPLVASFCRIFFLRFSSDLLVFSIIPFFIYLITGIKSVYIKVFKLR
jgi:hypothetical protein